MKRYTVRFYYFADLRCDWAGDAYDDRMALSLAMASNNLAEWCINDAFRIEIRKV
jgi:hypothetical protein